MRSVSITRQFPGHLTLLRLHSIEDLYVQSLHPECLQETYPHDTLCKNLTEYVPVTEAYAKRWYEARSSGL